MFADVVVPEPLEKILGDWDFFQEKVIAHFSTFKAVYPYPGSYPGSGLVGLLPKHHLERESQILSHPNPVISP